MRASALAFFLGIVLVQQLPVLPAPAWALLLLPLAYFAWREPRTLPLWFFVAGVVWAAVRADLVLDDRLPPALEGRDLIVTGTVADIPRATNFGTRFEFAVADAQLDGAPVTAPARVLLTSAHPLPTPRAGETWRLQVRLKRPHGFQNPGGFDYEAYLFRARLGATGYVRADFPPVRLAPSTDTYAIDALRQTLGERIRRALRDHPQAGLVVALANGDGSGVNESQWEILRRTGTLHLVAISGLHISLIGGLAFFLGRFLWALPGYTVLRLPAAHAGAALAILAAAGYAALAGFVVPTQRALIMLTVAMVALWWRRRLPASTILALALLLVLLHDPLAVLAAGFWLSFAAVGLILYVAQGSSPLSWWRRFGYLQWAIALGLLPLLLWQFQQAALIAPLANLIAIPVFDLYAVPLTLFGIAALGVGLEQIAGYAFVAAATGLNGLWHALKWLAAFDLGQWTQHRPGIVALVGAGIGIAWLLAPRGWPARWVGAVWLLPLVALKPAAPAAGEVWFTLLDVGQGLAAVVRTQHHVLVYDTGARFNSGFDAGRAVVLPYLRSQGIDRIDSLMVSHGDNDHIGGVQAVRELPVAQAWSGAPTRVAGTACVAGQSWRWDGVEFYLLHPPADTTTPANDASCVLSIKSAHGTILLPGDIAKATERRLLQTGAADLAADILVAPHHGSKSSSTPAFIEAVRPRHVLFAAGYRNRYRHPHPQVVERYAAVGARLYHSAADGAVEFRLRDGGIDVRRYREQHRRYWFARANAGVSP